MPSTPRNKIGCAVPALVAAALLIAGVALLPGPPQGPRYEGAGGEPRSGGTFVFHHESNVRSLDPHITFDELSSMAIRLMFDGLLDYNENTELIPVLAEAMPTVSEDGLHYRFRLRRGVKFHPLPGHPDGRELTSADVVYSMRRLLSPATGSPGFSYFSSILGADAYHGGSSEELPGVEAVDRYTVDFHLARRDHTFLNAMAMHFAYPVARETFDHWGEEAKFHPTGTGPFVFEEWERDVQLLFRRNTQYWQPNRANADRMVFQENLHRGLAAQRFRNGDLDALHRLSPSDYNFFKNSEAWRPYLVEEPRISVYGVGMNTQMPPFDNRHIRRAIAFALDRDGWNRARAGRLLPADQLLPPQMPGYEENMEDGQRYDLDRAREEMRLAGYPDGLPEPITVWNTGTDETSRVYGELLQHDLAQIGIEVEIRSVSFAVYLTESGKPNTVPCFFTGWNMDFPDPSNFLETLFHSDQIHPENSQNRSFFNSPEFDAMMDRARSEQDADARLAIYQEANRYISREAPWAMGYYTLNMEIWQPYVKGYRPHPVWSEDYRNVWLDEPRRRITHMLQGHPATRLAAQLFPFGGL